MIGAYNDIQDRLYEIDKSWRNNLIFYGIPADSQGKYYRSDAGTLYSTLKEEVIECIHNISGSHISKKS